MILYSLVAVLAVGLSLPVDNHYENKGFLYTRQQVLNRLCLVSVFLLLFLVSALRLNVGNDYAKYVEFMPDGTAVSARKIFMSRHCTAIRIHFS